MSKIYLSNIFLTSGVGCSLTALSSASSPQTLKIMLMVVVLFLPVVLAYQIWAYFLFKGEVTEKDMVY